MANFHQTGLISLVLNTLTFLLYFQVSIGQMFGPKSSYFDKIYQFGASKADTGNLIRENPSGAICSSFPYGENFFRGVTGRCSDGLLIIDYTALSAGLPFLNPYLETGADFSNGVNFAVVGSTALPVETLAAMNISSPLTSSSLNVQLDWMASYFDSTCHIDKDCVEKNANALFIVGEIGYNDYNYALSQGKSIQEAIQMVPQIVGEIANGVRRVIKFGATQVMVPGNFPFGCFPLFLTGFQTNDSTAYDEEFHCLKDINKLSIYHNEQLQQAIDELKAQNPNITIFYADYYNAYLWILSKALLLGFDINAVQKACCGIGGAYNYDMSRFCGTPGVPVCPNPYRYISWDGTHFTQHAHKLIFEWLTHNKFTKLPIHFLNGLQMDANLNHLIQ